MYRANRELGMSGRKHNGRWISAGVPSRALRGGALRAHSPSVHVRPLLPLVVAHLAATVTARGQAPVDPALAPYIARLRAIDNHAHPMRPVAKGELPHTAYDPLPLDGIPPFPR